MIFLEGTCVPSNHFVLAQSQKHASVMIASAEHLPPPLTHDGLTHHCGVGCLTRSTANVGACGASSGYSRLNSMHDESNECMHTSAGASAGYAASSSSLGPTIAIMSGSDGRTAGTLTGVRTMRDASA
eukprot:353183-Chlamydomonas_euryale.AAC.6